jgi:transcriptional regulator with XRE-family HTH domain
MSDSIKNVILPAQCRAARALLGWSQDQLEAASTVAKKTIADFERGARTPYDRTLADIQRALEAAGIEFTGQMIGGPGPGVRQRNIRDTEDWPYANFIIKIAINPKIDKIIFYRHSNPETDHVSGGTVAFLAISGENHYLHDHSDMNTNSEKYEDAILEVGKHFNTFKPGCLRAIQNVIKPTTPMTLEGAIIYVTAMDSVKVRDEFELLSILHSAEPSE